MASPNFDAFLLVSFGGPEQPDDVIPFLENVLRGRDVPRERLLLVAEHYYHFDGKSPINQQNRELKAALETALNIPVYWGNRNWHPLLVDTLAQMKADGVQRAVALPTSAFGSYSGCRQYLQDIEKACVAVPGLEISKLRPFSRHPLFLEAMTERVRPAVAELPGAQLVFTAHSIPMAMAQTSPYVEQLETASRHVAQAVGITDWTLVYQSRSGPPTQPWLGPDICDHLKATKRDTIIAPIGFVSDHMEVLYDLDTEAKAVAAELGIRMLRTGTVGTHPLIIQMVAEMVADAQNKAAEGLVPEACLATCCPAPVRPARP